MTQAQLIDMSDRPGSLAWGQPRPAPEEKLPLRHCVAIIGSLSLGMWWLIGLTARMLLG